MSVLAGGVAGLLCAATVSGIAGATAASAAPGGRKPLDGSMITASARKHPAGAVSKSAAVNFEVVLKLRNAAAAQALVTAVSTPGSASYRHYLTAAQWEARFSPAAAEVSSARSWLASEGFKVGATSRDRITISASGTAAQVEKAFGTTLGMYKVNGHVVRLATHQMSVPPSVAGSVVGALGINQNVATTARPPADREPRRAPPARWPAAGGTSPARAGGLHHGPAVRPVLRAEVHDDAAAVRARLSAHRARPGVRLQAAPVPFGLSHRFETAEAASRWPSSTPTARRRSASDSTRYFAMNDPGNPFSNAHFSQLLTTPFNNQTLCAASGWLTEQAIDVRGGALDGAGTRTSSMSARRTASTPACSTPSRR